MNLKTVKELVLDEHKLVTYVSLSKELCIHVNEAKSLLFELITDIKRTHPETDLTVSYMISGLLNNNNGFVTVCSETDLKACKRTLKTIFYEHIYSVSRGHNPVDNVVLAATNKFDDLSLCTGLIRANLCSKRADEEMGNLKSKSIANLNSQKTTSIKVKQDKDVKKLEDTTITKSELTPNVKTEIPSPKKNQVNYKKSPTKSNGKKATGKGIAGFFNKVGNDSSVKTKKAKAHEPEIKVEKDVKVESTNVDTNTTDDATKNVSSKSVKVKASDTLTQIKKTAKVDKKRKRLLHVSDSENETEENDPFDSNEMDINESEDEIPPTPTINTVKITSGIVNPRKRRKIVDKTYTDEDGYILTKKEEVYESLSENEDTKDDLIQNKENSNLENGHSLMDSTQKSNLIKKELSPKENKTKKKISPPKKGKQPSISNFFKKV